MLDSKKLEQEINKVKKEFPYLINEQDSLGLDTKFENERYYLSIDESNNELIIGFLFKQINEDFYWITLDYLKLTEKYEDLTENKLSELEKSEKSKIGHIVISSFRDRKKAQDCLKYRLEGTQDFEEFIANFNNLK